MDLKVNHTNIFVLFSESKYPDIYASWCQLWWKKSYALIFLNPDLELSEQFTLCSGGGQMGHFESSTWQMCGEPSDRGSVQKLSRRLLDLKAFQRLITCFQSSGTVHPLMPIGYKGAFMKTWHRVKIFFKAHPEGHVREASNTLGLSFTLIPMTRAEQSNDEPRHIRSSGIP